MSYLPGPSIRARRLTWQGPHSTILLSTVRSDTKRSSRWQDGIEKRQSIPSLKVPPWSSIELKRAMPDASPGVLTTGVLSTLWILFVVFSRPPPRLGLLPVEDLRRERQNALQTRYATLDGRPAVVVRRDRYTPAMQGKGMSPRLQDVFQTPQRVAVCARRRTRRRVIFSLRRTGKAGRRNRRPRWSAQSRISCVR